MAYKGCPHCGKTIDAESTTYRHCERDLNDVTPRWLCTSCSAETNPVSLSRFASSRSYCCAL